MKLNFDLKLVLVLLYTKLLKNTHVILDGYNVPIEMDLRSLASLKNSQLYK